MMMPLTFSILLLLALLAQYTSAFQALPPGGAKKLQFSTLLHAKKKKGGAATAAGGGGPKVQVRLKQHIAGTGQAGDIIMVTPAFFNNKLRPQQLAERISDEQKEELVSKKQAKQAAAVAAATHLQETLGYDEEKGENNFILSFKDNKTGPDGKKLFGGINAKKLLSKLQKEVPDEFLKNHKQVKILEVVEEESGNKVKSSDIKQIGDYSMKLQLTKELFVKIKVVVE